MSKLEKSSSSLTVRPYEAHTFCRSEYCLGSAPSNAYPGMPAPPCPVSLPQSSECAGGSMVYAPPPPPPP